MHIKRSRLDAGTEQWRLVRGECELSFAQAVAAWVEDRAFRAAWIAGLREVEFSGTCWECPPVTAATASRPFECVFVRSDALAGMAPDREAFSEHFQGGHDVVTFGNLGNDAWLVAPCPGAGASDCSHLASFTATAPAAQQDALWRAVGQAMQERMGASRVWLSTAGHGVAWLHVRLDSRPKYYRHEPYRSG